MRQAWNSRGALAAAVATFTLAAGPLAANEVDDLRRQVQALNEKLIELEQRQAETEAKAEDTKSRAVLATGKAPGSFILPGTNTEFQVGGYIKGDLIFDVNEKVGDVFDQAGITTAGDDNAGFNAHARQSRIFIKTSTPTEMGALKTHIEGDFFGGGGNQLFSNSHSFRLRHAYGEIGPLLVGQFWTNFMPIESYPNTLDFQGPAGMPFIRQAQIRYTQPVSDKLTISASLENSEVSGRGVRPTATDPRAVSFISESTTSGIKAGLDVLPDATVAFTYRDDFGLLKLAGVGRLLDATGTGEDEFGWGVNASGNLKLWPGGSLMFSGTYGDGVGRYLINGFGNDVFVRADGSLETIKAYGAMLGVSQKVTDEVTVGLVYGRYEALETFRNTDLESVNSVHASLFWSPVERLTLGGEVIYGTREDRGGADDDNIRLQASAQFNF